ncbi:MAG TPA: hypothetical protein ENJ29_13210 [Bacteroidetes bacterium]|nr:hypothetical protein [Bacteroidota bacterium]
MLKFYQRIKPDLSDLHFGTKTGSLPRSLSFGQHRISPQRREEREEQSRVVKICTSSSRNFISFFLASLAPLRFKKNAQMPFKLSSQNVSTVSDMKIKKATGYPVLSALA